MRRTLATAALTLLSLAALAGTAAADDGTPGIHEDQPMCTLCMDY